MGMKMRTGEPAELFDYVSAIAVTSLKYSNCDAVRVKINNDPTDG